MASLNLSINGPSIKSSYQGVINGPALPSTSATAARWALFTVQAPLLSAFQATAAKESILKVESTGGECDDAAPPFGGHFPRSAFQANPAFSAQTANSPSSSRTSAKAASSLLLSESRTQTRAFRKMS
jgi:hypothetical protein